MLEEITIPLVLVSPAGAAWAAVDDLSPHHLPQVRWANTAAAQDHSGLHPLASLFALSQSLQGGDIWAIFGSRSAVGRSCAGAALEAAGA